MLQVSHIGKTFRTEKGELEAVRDVSFRVEKGEIYGLIGLSGAGKSTLVRCLNLLERPDTGSVFFDGKDLCTLDEAELARERRRIGMIFQHFNLFEQKTVFENIAFPLREAGMKRPQIKEKVDELLRFVDLQDKKKVYPSELSGGQKQRVAIARSLACDPELILSDEGTSALDPETSKQILTLLKRAVRETGTAVVLITHQMEVARSICDRVGVMEDGRIVEENTVEALFLHPKHARTRSFIRTLQDELGDLGERPEAALGEADKGLERHDAADEADAEASAKAAGASESADLERFAKKRGNELYRLAFLNRNVYRPLVSELARTFDVEINLLAGNINWLREGEQRVGYLTVELIGTADEKQRALEWLEENGVDVEVIS